MKDGKLNKVVINGLKKVTAVLLIMLISCVSFTGCGETKTDKKFSIVCTIFPEYDWVKQILGDRVEDYDITLLLQNGTDMHSYQPTAKDIAEISTCDMFIFVGGEADSWTLDVLSDAKNKDMKVINLMEILGTNVIEEDCTLDHNHSEHDHEGHEEVEYDEHVWLSLRNSIQFVKAINEKISQLDIENSAYYEKNAESLVSKMDELDNKIKNFVASSNKTSLVFADRFPFIYFTNDYNLDYYAAFPGCSAETEASFETIVNLAKKTDELNLNSICVLENSDEKLANTVKSNTSSKNQNIVVFDSMQSITKKDISEGKTYMDYMEHNFESLKKALN